MIALACSGCMSILSTGAFLPILPEIAAELTLSPAATGTLATLHAFAAAVMTPPLGYFADRIGASRLLIMSLIAYAAAGVSGAFITDVETLTINRLAVGVATAGVTAATLGILTRLVAENGRTQLLGNATAFLTLAGVLTFLIGGFVGAFKWHYAFYLHALSLPVAAAIIWFHQKGKLDGARRASDQLKLGSLREFVSTPILACLILIFLFGGLGYSANIFGPLRARETFGLEPDQIGVLLAMVGIGVVLSSVFLAARLARAAGQFGAISIGMIVIAIAFFGFASAPNAILMGVAFFVFGVGFGIVMPTTFDRLASLAVNGSQSLVMGSGSSAAAFGRFSAPVGFGIVATMIGVGSLLMAISAAVLICSVAIWIIHKRQTS